MDGSAGANAGGQGGAVGGQGGGLAGMGGTGGSGVSPAALYVALDGNDNNPGTFALPFATLEAARDAIRDMKKNGGLPEAGVVVSLREGTYYRASSFVLDAQDSGDATHPIVYRAQPGETVRITGAQQLDPSWFAAVTQGSDAAVWKRLDAAAQGNVVAVDLPSHGISDYGALHSRGYGEAKPSPSAAMELFIDGAVMELARWPDKVAPADIATLNDDVVHIRGDIYPDVAGRYVKYATVDGKNAYKREGLVDGAQYYLYHYSWTSGQNQYAAWFLAPKTSGYPGGQGAAPFWSRYSDNFDKFSPSKPTGAVGFATNRGFALTSCPQPSSNPPACNGAGTSFSFEGKRPERWSAASDVWFHGFWRYHWADAYRKASAINTGQKTVTFNEPTPFGIYEEKDFYALNLLEEITVPGEWYVDRATGMLYLWPPGNLVNADIAVSMLDGPLVKLDGGSYISFEDLTFEGTRRELVSLTGDNNRLHRCTLRNTGRSGALITGSDSGLERCQVYGTGDKGVALVGGVRASLTAANLYVRNSEIWNFSRWSMTYRPAVSSYGVGHHIANNHFHDAPHAAVIFYGNNHLIELNDIHHVCEISSDIGAIYAGRHWGYRGNLIRHNFVHDLQSPHIWPGVHGVYLDDALAGVHVFGNVFYRIGGAAVLVNGGRDSIVDNNVIARCNEALWGTSRGITLINNIPNSSSNFLERLTDQGVKYQQEPWASAYPELAAIPNDWNTLSDPMATWLYPENCVFSKNIGYQNTVWMKETNHGGTGTFNKYAEIADNIEDQDPLFVDEAKLNLALQPGSPALAIPGFVPIPFDKIGIQAAP